MSDINSLIALGYNAEALGSSGTFGQKERFDAVAKAAGTNYCIDMIRGVDGSIKSVCAGDMIEAHKAGIRYLNAMCLKMLPCPADIVIVSSGGSPADSDLVHALPALDHARMAVRKGGSVLFIASCKNGIGSEELEDILTNAVSLEELLTLSNKVAPEVREACSILGLALTESNVWFISEQEDPLFDKVFPNHKPNAQAALDAILANAPRDALVLSMPFGLHTVPVITERK